MLYLISAWVSSHQDAAIDLNENAKKLFVSTPFFLYSTMHLVQKWINLKRAKHTIEILQLSWLYKLLQNREEHKDTQTFVINIFTFVLFTITYHNGPHLLGDNTRIDKFFKQELSLSI